MIEITLPRGRRFSSDGVVVHRVLDLDRADLMVVEAIPTTTPTRTLIDLAGVLPADAVEEALDDALRRRLTSISRLQWRLRDLGTKGRPGIAVIRRLIDGRSNVGVPQSVLETRLLRLVKRARLSRPECQHQIRDERGRLVGIVDFAYPQARLAIEVDGYRWHSGRARWEYDLGRRNKLTRLGWRILHVTATDIEQRPDETAAAIAAVLQRAQQEG